MERPHRYVCYGKLFLKIIPMIITQYINQLCRNIINERFNWHKYLQPKKYFGKNICIVPLHASYGLIGYTIYFPSSKEPIPNIEYDREMNCLNIEGIDWKKWIANAEKKLFKDNVRPYP